MRLEYGECSVGKRTQRVRDDGVGAMRAVIAAVATGVATVFTPGKLAQVEMRVTASCAGDAANGFAALYQRVPCR